MNGRQWSEDELAVLRRITLGHADAGLLIDRTPNAVRKKRIKMGIQIVTNYSNPGRLKDTVWTEEMLDVLFEKHPQDIEAAAKELGLPFEVVRTKRKMLGFRKAWIVPDRNVST